MSGRGGLRSTAGGNSYGRTRGREQGGRVGREAIWNGARTLLELLVVTNLFEYALQ